MVYSGDKLRSRAPAGTALCAFGGRNIRQPRTITDDELRLVGLTERQVDRLRFAEPHIRCEVYDLAMRDLMREPSSR